MHEYIADNRLITNPVVSFLFLCGWEGTASIMSLRHSCEHKYTAMGTMPGEWAIPLSKNHDHEHIGCWAHWEYQT